MRYHEVLLVPATGHFGPGSYNPGPNYGKHFELDVTREVLQTMAEELENDRIRYRLFELWKAPGWTHEAMRREAAENAISLHLSFGRVRPKGDGKNATKAWFSDPGALWLARMLGESASEWARCSNYHHVLSQPQLHQGFFPHHAVLLEPFSLAGDDTEPYLLRLRQLGVALAHSVSEFFRTTDQAVRWKPLGAWQNEKKKDDDRSLVSTFLRAVDGGQLDPLQAPDQPQSAAKMQVPNLPSNPPLDSASAQAAPDSSSTPSAQGKRRRPS